jgi:hypothetical protein
MSHLLINDYEQIVDDNVLVAKLIIGIFMILMSILHLPQLLGPKFSPFTTLYYVGTTGKMMVWKTTSTTTIKATKEKKTLSNPSSNDGNHDSSSKSEKKKKKQ